MIFLKRSRKRLQTRYFRRKDDRGIPGLRQFGLLYEVVWYAGKCLSLAKALTDVGSLVQTTGQPDESKLPANHPPKESS